MASANENNFLTTLYLLDADTTFIATIPSGESKSLRMFYVVFPMISITVLVVFFF